MRTTITLRYAAVIGCIAAGASLGSTAAYAGTMDGQPQTTPPPAPVVLLADKGGKGMIKQACGEDVKKLCPDVKPGGGRILQCLEQHAKDVSDNCAKLLERRAHKRDQHQPAPQQ